MSGGGRECSLQFTAPSANSFYLAWSGMNAQFALSMGPPAQPCNPTIANLGTLYIPSGGMANFMFSHGTASGNPASCNIIIRAGNMSGPTTGNNSCSADASDGLPVELLSFGIE